MQGVLERRELCAKRGGKRALQRHSQQTPSGAAKPAWRSLEGRQESAGLGALPMSTGPRE